VENFDLAEDECASAPHLVAGRQCQLLLYRRSRSGIHLGALAFLGRDAMPAEWTWRVTTPAPSPAQKPAPLHGAETAAATPLGFDWGAEPLRVQVVADQLPQSNRHHLGDCLLVRSADLFHKFVLPDGALEFTVSISVRLAP
jgi:hypothetical protein